MPRISANLGFLWKGLPLVEAVRRAKAAGFEAVEFHEPYSVPVGEMQAALKQAGLAVAGINTRMGDTAAGEFGMAAIPGREAETRAAIDEAIAYATAIGAGYVQVTAGRVAEDQRAAARKTLLAALDYASGKAEGAGLVIVIEALNPRDAAGAFLNSSELAASVIGELGRPNVNFLFDCYHVQIVEGDLTRRLEKLMPIVGHIQMAGVPARAEPDEGEVNYRWLLRKLDELGYSRFVGAEYRARGEVEAGLGWLKAFRS